MIPWCPAVAILSVFVILCAAHAEPDVSGLMARSLVSQGDTSRLQHVLARARRGVTDLTLSGAASRRKVNQSEGPGRAQVAHADS